MFKNKSLQYTFCRGIQLFPVFIQICFKWKNRDEGNIFLYSSNKNNIKWQSLSCRNTITFDAKQISAKHSGFFLTKVYCVANRWRHLIRIGMLQANWGQITVSLPGPWHTNEVPVILSRCLLSRFFGA